MAINKTPDFQWTFLYWGKAGSKACTYSEPNTNYCPEAGASVSISEPAEIEDGKEVVIYGVVFNDEPQLVAVDVTRIVNNLDKFVYVHLLKCKFTK